uniref:EF-hand protein 5 variant 1 n=1 Tax=Lygus hesperus TaxID=30085 RepID=A0A0A9W7P5_LYGHE
MGDTSNLIFGDVWTIISRIQSVLQRSPQLDIVGFLRRLDPHKERLIQESDFLMALCSVYQKYLGISEAEMKKVAEYFRVPDGRILYEQFCQFLENDPPYNGAGERLTTGLEFTDYSESANHFLEATEMERYDFLLNKIAARVINDDISLKAHLTEYEMISKNTGHITISHFARLLHALNIFMDENDFGIIVKRLARHHYTINYIAFYKDVEERVCKMLDGKLNMSQFLDDSKNRKISAYDASKVGYLAPQQAEFDDQVPWHNVMRTTKKSFDIVNTIRHIQQSCMNMGIRFKEWFQTFDPKLTGKVTPDDFMRELTFVSVGTNGPNRVTLQPNEMETIIDIYRDPSNPNMIMWKEFAKDIEGVYLLPPNSEKRGVESFGTLDQNSWGAIASTVRKAGNEWESTSARTRKVFEDAMQKIRFYKEAFKIHFATEFNRSPGVVNDGYTEVLSFYKVFSKIIPYLTPEEIRSVIVRYSDNRGFNYRQMLFDMQEDIEFFPQKWDIPEAPSHLSSITKKVDVPSDPVTLGEVFQKIRLKVHSERVDLQQFFEQYDPIHTLYITQEQFRRALSSAGIRNISPEDLEIIIQAFTRPFAPDCLEYTRFVDALEMSNYRKNLELDPLVVPIKSIPIEDGRHNFLQLEERQELRRILYSLSEKADFFELDSFKAYDKAKRGTIPKDNFWQVISTLGGGIRNYLDDRDVDILFRGVGKLVGPVLELDYHRLCWLIHNLHKIYNGYPGLKPPPPHLIPCPPQPKPSPAYCVRK